MENIVNDFNQEAYAIFKKYDVDPNDLQNIAEVKTGCSNFTVIVQISDIFGSVNKISGMEKEGNHHFIRINDNSEIRMIIREDELKHIQKGNYYIITHIDCGIYNRTKKLRTTLSSTFTPIRETDAKKIISHFPKKMRVRKRIYGYGTKRFYYDDYDEFPEYDDYDPEWGI